MYSVYVMSEQKINIKKLRLLSKALKHMPNSPTQLKIRKEIAKL